MKNKSSVMVAYALALFLLVSALFGGTGSLVVYAAQSGVVQVNSSLNVRQKPSTSATVLGKLTNGTTVTILSTSGDWYEIEYNGGSGYVSASYVKMIQDSTDNTGSGTDTENTGSGTNTGSTNTDASGDADNFSTEGFPESYKSYLTALHKKYPNWVFTPVNTGLDWSTVISNESKLGRNLVNISADDSWKSTATGAYTWETNSWAGYDGSSWVAASQAAVEYCMDPRNYLNATDIYQFATLEYVDYQTENGTASILASSFMSGAHTDGSGKKYASTFVTAGQKYGVNPYHLAVRCLQEQGTKGTSPLISGKYSGYTGYYNYFNIGAYPANGNNSTVNGLIYAKGQGWNTVQKSILGGAQIVGKRYVAIGQNTLYFQKFNVVYTASLYSHQYMTNIQAATSEAANLKKGYTDSTQALEFLIPVYNNMPENACAKPSSGNPNNYLKSLSISGCTLTPAFSGSTTSYSVIVGKSVDSVTLSASAVASTSTVSGTGKKSLEYGTNTFTVKCTAQNGDVKKYTIQIVREQPEEDTFPADALVISGSSKISSPYTFDEAYVRGFQIGDSVQDVLSSIRTKDCTVSVTDAKGQAYTGTMATGCILNISDSSGKTLKSYTVVINGDVNGDGKISKADVKRMKKQILGIKSLSGAYAQAADTDKKGDGITNHDLVLLRKHLRNLFELEQ
jgi:beta-N-acetylglucosaminidase/uncharacterized protein YraI